MARQRQQRSILRTSDIPLDESLAENAPLHSQRELAILRSEVAASGTTISELKLKLQQSDSELEQMGSQTAEMAEDLRRLQLRAAEVQKAAAGTSEVDVAISLPADVDLSSPDALANLSVCISFRQEGA